MGRTVANHRVCRRRALPARGIDHVRSNSLGLPAAVLVLLSLAAWSYWPIIASLSHTLRTSDDYGAGQLVPLVAVFFVWRERKTLRQLELSPCWWGGIALLLLAEMARIYGFLSMRQSIERYALVLAVAGLILMVAGRQVFRRISWILLFLLLMVPLPNLIHSRIGPPLQRMATTGSAFLLEAFGAQVTQEGNVLTLNGEIPLAIAEACSGLRMLMAFVIVAAFIAYMVKRSKVRKAVLLLSSIPVAVVCNIIRISLTAMIMLHVSAELGEKFFHDFAGLVMMPAAVSLLFGGLWLMDRLVEPNEGSSAQQRKVIRAKTRRQVSTRAAGL